jgi:hypothetical protein
MTNRSTGIEKLGFFAVDWAFQNWFYTNDSTLALPIPLAQALRTNSSRFVLAPPDPFSPAKELTQKGLQETQAPLLSGSKP